MSGGIRIIVDGHPVPCQPGIPLSQVLSLHMIHWRRSPRLDQPRGMFCGMGVCFECVVQVDGAQRRSCLTMTAEGMQVQTMADPGGDGNG